VRLLLPLPPDRRTARVAVLLAGLVLYGASIALLLRSTLGLMPWSVLDSGLAASVGGRVGTWSILTGVAVLLTWVPLRLRPGLGTLANVVVVGLAIDATSALVPAPAGTAARWGLLVAGVLLNGAATGLYVGAGLGPGPRDGLALGLAARTRLPLRLVRSGLELVVLGLGWALGGAVGWGTLVYALAIGPLMHLAVPLLALRPRPAAIPRPAVRGAAPGAAAPGE
jgi:uncharacterized membrane protein YczE